MAKKAAHRKIQRKTTGDGRPKAADVEYSALIKKYQTLLSSLDESVVAVDEDGGVSYMNPAAERMFGLKYSDIAGKPYQLEWNMRDQEGKVVPPQERAINLALRSKKPVSTEKFDIVPQNAPSFPAAITVTPVSLEPHSQDAVAVYRDISEEKRISRIKDEFISLASHQLRTPLSVIKWYSEALESDRLGKLNPKQTEHLGQIKAHNQRLIDLVEGLLSVARIDQGKYIPVVKEVDIRQAVGRILEILEPTIEAKHLKYDRKSALPTRPVMIDPQMLDVVLQNLLTNAVDYTPERGKFGYGIVARGGLLRIEVWDTGCGIPKDEQAKLFQKFFRASNARKIKPNGTGLGLYMVKALVEGAGGKIRIKSEENRGTRFFVDMPLGPAVPKT